MSLYTMIFILVAVLILIGIALMGFLISKLDKWIDKRDRVGQQSIYKAKKKEDADKKEV
ncbi:MAG: hypothetical protein RBS48_05800 [Ignavibacteriaceae bacterium]|nr:hypothetical protein [Ignavibacteriaceae bacterium]